MPETIKFDADRLLEDALLKHKIALDVLVAETAIWASPTVHQWLCENGNGAKYPNRRRARTGRGEVRNGECNGIRFDDNTYANNAIKWAVGIRRSEIKGYEACHIWPGTCYDERYHTVIANLVLLPRALAGLTDHNQPIRALLQYRAYELYEWYPDESEVPVKPENYVTCWREPELDISIGRRRSLRRDGVRQPVRNNLTEKIKKWASSPDLNVHKIIALMLRHEGMSKNAFVQLVESYAFSSNASGAVASLMTNAGNAYGLVLKADENNCLFIHPDVRTIVRQLDWR